MRTPKNAADTVTAPITAREAVSFVKPLNGCIRPALLRDAVGRSPVLFFALSIPAVMVEWITIVFARVPLMCWGRDHVIIRPAKGVGDRDC